ncbi:hypothetical protein ACH4E8_07310 [Streptomyces sp. NPDC017979]|uniref:hypothetical protein n=1 Tax=Streptomyces sp. NPDC017979 TaxID=3365024 RepID=UPI0037949C0A
MTQSGHGDGQRHPAARPAHEGVVLPAEGSDPWIPDTPAPQQHTTPASGVPWGEPWGPQGGAGQAPPPSAPPTTAPGAVPLPPEAPPTGAHAAAPHQGGHPATPHRGGHPAAPLPPAGLPPQAAVPGAYPPGMGPEAYPPGAVPGAYASPVNPEHPNPAPYPPAAHPGPLPPVAGELVVPPQAPPVGPGGGAMPPPAQPGPQPYGAADATQLIPPIAPGAPFAPGTPSGSGTPSGPGAGDATQVIAPVPAGPPPPGPGALPPEQSYGAGAVDATQVIPPVPAGGGDATQVIPPVPTGPAADPPTTFLGTGRLGQQGPGRGGEYGAGRGAEPVTQHLPPVSDAAVPGEFDMLFRAQAESGAGWDDARHAPGGAHGGRGGRGGRASRANREDREERRRKSSQLAVMGAVIVACAVLGLGVSAALFGPGDDDAPKSTVDRNAPPPSAPADAGTPPPSPSAPSPSTAAADPVRTQAVALDKLLADSNSSRAAVLRSVENIKQCKELDRAASDLRAAAKQRRAMVTRLEGVSVDKLPRNAELTAALKQAWQSSATADDHYAAWATQVKGKKGCKDDRARSTRSTVAANRASGEATKAKRQAAGYWNAIAATHDLPRRSGDQL